MFEIYVHITLNQDRTGIGISDFSFEGLIYHKMALLFWIKVGEDSPLFYHLKETMKLHLTKSLAE